MVLFCSYKLFNQYLKTFFPYKSFVPLVRNFYVILHLQAILKISVGLFKGK